MHCQQVRGGNPSSLLSAAEPTPAVLCSVLIFPIQEGQGHAERTVKLNKELECLSPEKKKKRAGIVYPEEDSEEISSMYINTPRQGAKRSLFSGALGTGPQGMVIKSKPAGLVQT